MSFIFDGVFQHLLHGLTREGEREREQRLRQRAFRADFGEYYRLWRAANGWICREGELMGG